MVHERIKRKIRTTKYQVARPPISDEHNIARSGPVYRIFISKSSIPCSPPLPDRSILAVHFSGPRTQQPDHEPGSCEKLRCGSLVVLPLGGAQGFLSGWNG